LFAHFCLLSFQLTFVPRSLNSTRDPQRASETAHFQLNDRRRSDAVRRPAGTRCNPAMHCLDRAPTALISCIMFTICVVAYSTTLYCCCMNYRVSQHAFVQWLILMLYNRYTTL
jgi:hypothetical protein